MCFESDKLHGALFSCSSSPLCCHLIFHSLSNNVSKIMRFWTAVQTNMRPRSELSLSFSSCHILSRCSAGLIGLRAGRSAGMKPAFALILFSMLANKPRRLSHLRNATFPYSVDNIQTALCIPIPDYTLLTKTPHISRHTR